MTTLKPITTRSALLSLLLAAETPSLTARELVAAGSLVGFAEPAVRVALSRMVAAGDVLRDQAGGYLLSARLVERQRRQHEAIHPDTIVWRDRWEVVVVTATGRSAADRAELRTTLAQLRLAELREGVWTRPANLRRRWSPAVREATERYLAVPETEAAELVARLWDLEAWAAHARFLLQHTDAADPALRFNACAVSVRHLLADPLLPAALLPADWPGDELREAHLRSRHWLNEVRAELAASSA